MIQFTIERMLTYLGPAVGSGLTLLIGHYLKVRRIKLYKKKQDPVTECVKNNILVEHKLDAILKDFQADRVYLLQFHNGGNFYPSGRSVLKFSVFYEKTMPGIVPVRERYQNIPVSIFGRFFSYLSENTISYYYDIKKPVDEDYDVKGFSRDTDAKSSYCVGLKTIDDKFMGVLVVHFIKKKKVLTDTEIKDIQVSASMIASTITSQSISK
jgi:hypothetical protein